MGQACQTIVRRALVDAGSGSLASSTGIGRFISGVEHDTGLCTFPTTRALGPGRSTISKDSGLRSGVTST